jgi:hypothetical protein
MTREAMQHAFDALTMPCDRWNSGQTKIVNDAVTALREALAQPSPAWHDAPTGPGVWLCDEGDIVYKWTTHEIIFKVPDDEGVRWYGPIPKDEGES